MQIDISKHFKKTEIEDSEEDEDFVPEEEEAQSTLHVPRKRPILDVVNLKSMKEEVMDREMKRIKQCTSEFHVDEREIADRASAMSKEIKTRQPENQTSQKQYVFADKFYTLINESILKEVEKPSVMKHEMEMGNDPAEDYFATLSFKLAATEEIINHLGHNKHIKLTSILKSRFDWNSFMQKEKIEDKMAFHRKNDLLLRKFLLNNS